MSSPAILLERKSPPPTAHRPSNCQYTSLRGSVLLRQQTRSPPPPPVGTNFAESLTLHRHLNRTLPSSCRWMTSSFFHRFFRYRQFADDHYGARRQCVIVSATLTHLQTPLAAGVSLCTLEPCGHFEFQKTIGLAGYIAGLKYGYVTWAGEVILVLVCADRWDKSSHIAAHWSVLSKPS